MGTHEPLRFFKQRLVSNFLLSVPDNKDRLFKKFRIRRINHDHMPRNSFYHRYHLCWQYSPIRQQSFIFGALISAFWLPFRQREPLHCAEDPFFEFRIGGAEIIDQFLDLLALCLLIHRTAVLQDRQFVPIRKILDTLLMDIEHRADLYDTGPVKVRHRLEAVDSSLKQKRHHKCFHSVIVMMA